MNSRIGHRTPVEMTSRNDILFGMLKQFANRHHGRVIFFPPTHGGYNPSPERRGMVSERDRRLALIIIALILLVPLAWSLLTEMVRYIIQLVM